MYFFVWNCNNIKPKMREVVYCSLADAGVGEGSLRDFVILCFWFSWPTPLSVVCRPSLKAVVLATDYAKVF
jgi:hypothetical protein